MLLFTVKVLLHDDLILPHLCVALLSLCVISLSKRNCSILLL